MGKQHDINIDLESNFRETNVFSGFCDNIIMKDLLPCKLTVFCGIDLPKPCTTFTEPIRSLVPCLFNPYRQNRLINPQKEILTDERKLKTWIRHCLVTQRVEAVADSLVTGH